MKVRANFLLTGNPEHGANRLAVEEQNPFVALSDRREIALGHDPAGFHLGGLFENGPEVSIASPQRKYAPTTLAIEGFDDHLAAEFVQKVE